MVRPKKDEKDLASENYNVRLTPPQVKLVEEVEEHLRDLHGAHWPPPGRREMFLVLVRKILDEKAGIEIRIHGAARALLLAMAKQDVTQARKILVDLIIDEGNRRGLVVAYDDETNEPSVDPSFAMPHTDGPERRVATGPKGRAGPKAAANKAKRASVKRGRKASVRRR